MRLSALLLTFAGFVAICARPGFADGTSGYGSDAPDDNDVSLKDRFINNLPPAIGDGLDIDTWGWIGGLQTNYENSRYYDGELGLGIIKSFNQRAAVGAQVNFIDANGTTRFELEKGYLSVKLSDSTQTLLTVGKFNADIGVEERDFWNRTTATTSLLFAAKPQDLLGVMLTQPFGDSGFRLRSYISEGFESAYDFNQSPSAGLTAEYKPDRMFDVGITGWVGPGFLGYGGRHIQSPFPRAYGIDDPAAAVVENWEGPNFYASRGSTLYFADGSCVFRPTTDLAISGECLVGTSNTSEDRFEFGGIMAMANYDINDQLHVYGRWSYLDDSDWLITHVYQRCQELSAGAGYKIIEGLEVRGEYRHDFSNATPDFDSVSLDLTFTY